MFKQFPNGFDDWCLRPTPSSLPTGENFQTFCQNNQNNADRRELPSLYFESIMSRRRTLPLSILFPDTSDIKNYSFPFSDRLPNLPTDSESDDLFNLSFQENDGELLIGGAALWTVRISSPRNLVHLENCYIGNLKLEHSGQTDCNVFLKNCWVGQLHIVSHGGHVLEVEGGGIGSIKCPAPDSENPMTGSVSLKNVLFPTSTNQTKLFAGTQPYRNMRAHMEKLNNGPMASLFRTLELRCERKATDRGPARWLNALYDGASGYGSAIGRPLIWAGILYLLGVAYACRYDAGVAPLASELYTGWRASLYDPENGHLARSLFLPLQSMISPAGVFGARSLVTAQTAIGGAMFTAIGLMMDAMLFLSILAIRKRFKLP